MTKKHPRKSVTTSTIFSRARSATHDGRLVAQWALVACWIWVPLLAVFILLPRFLYAGPLDNQEGLMLLSAIRVIKGLSLYTPPTIDGFGWVYGPLYSWLMAPVTHWFGPSFSPLRAVSLACFAGILFTMTRICSAIGLRSWRQSLCIPVALLFFWPFGWIDIARQEAFWILLNVAGTLHAVKDRPNRFDLAMSGIFFGIAVFCKFTSILFLAIFFIVSALQRRYLILVAALIASFLILVAWSYYLYGLTYVDWVFAVPLTHPLKGYTLVGKAALVVSPLLITLILYTYRVFSSAWRNNSIYAVLVSADGKLIALSMVGIFIGLLGMLKSGGTIGSFWVAIPLLVVATLRYWQIRGSEAKANMKVFALCSIALLLLPLGFLHWAIAMTPTLADNRAVECVMAFGRSHENSWFTAHPWVNIRLDERPFAPLQQVALEWTEGGRPLNAGLIRSLETDGPDWIFLAEATGTNVKEAFMNSLSAGYFKVADLPSSCQWRHRFPPGNTFPIESIWQKR